MMNIFQLAKAVHIFGNFCWFAGIFFFYELLNYEFQHKRNGSKSVGFHEMESYAYFWIALPGMLVAFISGLVMAHLKPTLMMETWFQAKIGSAGLIMVITFHGITPLRKYRKGDLGKYTSLHLRGMSLILLLLLAILSSALVLG